MSKIIFSCILSYFFSNLANANINNAQFISVDHAVQQFVQAYQNRDVNQLVNLYDANALVIGTGSDEVIHGKQEIAAAIKRDFAQSANSHITIQKISIVLKNHIALASYFLHVNVEVPNNAPFKSTLRFTAALIKENNQWRILQSHLSAPLVNEKLGKSFPSVAT